MHPRRLLTRRTLLQLAAGVAAAESFSPVAAWASTTAVRRINKSLAVATPAASPSKPNVILITVDTLRADQLGCYGHPYVKTPTLDRLAAQGARFTRHMVQEPQTNPSHGSIFTGMYPSSSGIRIHMVDKLPPTLTSLAAQFSAAGYATAGLFSFMSLDPQYCNFQQGFATYKDLTAGEPLGQPGDIVKGRADQTTDAAIAQLQAFGAKPFFLWLHYFDAHCPYVPPSGFANLYDPDYRGSMNGGMATVNAILSGQLHPAGADLQRLIALYQGEISFLDSQLARLFGTLDQLALSPHTVVALTGDHGESFAEHTEFVTGGDMFHPCSLYDAEGRVPQLLRYPARIAAGKVVSAPTQAIDLFPTLLECAGLSVPEQAQGSSLLRLLDGRDDGSARVAYAAMPDFVFTSTTTARWKLIQNNATGQRRLYDLVTDTAEQRDVLTAYPEEADRLAGQLQTWMKAVKIS